MSTNQSATTRYPLRNRPKPQLVDEEGEVAQHLGTIADHDEPPVLPGLRDETGSLSLQDGREATKTCAELVSSSDPLSTSLFQRGRSLLDEKEYHHLPGDWNQSDSDTSSELTEISPEPDFSRETSDEASPGDPSSPHLTSGDPGNHLEPLAKRGNLGHKAEPVKEHPVQDTPPQQRMPGKSAGYRKPYVEDAEDEEEEPSRDSADSTVPQRATGVELEVNAVRYKNVGLDTPMRDGRPDQPNRAPDMLSSEQLNTVERARKQLSDRDRELIENRQRRVNANPREHNTNRERPVSAGPSNLNKGKAIDPWNWGEAYLSGDEIDPEVQRQILRACNDEMRRRKNTNENNEPKGTKDDPKNTEYDEDETEEETQTTRQILKERLRLQRELAREIRQLKKAEKKGRSKKKRTYTSSETDTEEEQEKVRSILNKLQKNKDRAGQKSKPRKKPEFEPAAQITEDSALGIAFKNMRKSSAPPDPGSSDSSEEDSDYNPTDSSETSSDSDSTETDSSGDESDSSGSSSSGDSTSSSSDEDRRRGGQKPKKSKGKSHRKDKKSHRKRRKNRKARRGRFSSKSIIKPTPPTAYNGAQDVDRFTRFMSHGTAYVQYGRVEPERQVMVLSEFLEGRAWKFYARDVARDPASWNLDRFFTGLFNEIFTVDFRQKMHEKLKNFQQGGHTVREYVASLEELFAVVGSQSKGEMVMKLFQGFRKSIRKGLYHAGLTPEQSSWSKIIRKAKFLERAEAVDHEVDQVSSYNKSRRYGPDKSDSPPYDRKGDPTRRRMSNIDGSGGRNKSQFVGKRTNNTPGAQGQRGRFTPRDSQKFVPRENNNVPQPTVNREKMVKDKRGETKRLSAEDEAQYRTENRCFRCGEQGHMSRNCPTARHARSSRPGKPPGVQSNSVRIDLQEIDKLREEAFANLRELPVNAIGFEGLPFGDELMNIIEAATDSDNIGAPVVAHEDERSPLPPSSGDDEIPALVDLADLPDESIARPRETSEPYDRPTLATSRHRIILSEPMDFGNDSYDYEVKSAEEKIELIWEEEVLLGRPRKLGQATCKKLEYLLELMQPYPGDPNNYLQLKGKRFNARGPDRQGKLEVWDRVRRLRYSFEEGLVAQARYPVGIEYAKFCSRKTQIPTMNRDHYFTTLRENTWIWNARETLELGAPYAPGESALEPVIGRRFDVSIIQQDPGIAQITDSLLELRVKIELAKLYNPEMDIVNWYRKAVSKNFTGVPQGSLSPEQWERIMTEWETESDIAGPNLRDLDEELGRIGLSIRERVLNRLEGSSNIVRSLELNGQQVERGTYPALQRNAVRRRNLPRMIPKPVIVVVRVNNHPVRALIDSGSLGDFMSTTLVQQLRLEKEELEESVPVQLAAQGSRSKVNYGVTASFRYQGISCDKYFDVMNLNGYDLILGTPCIYQHKVMIGLNPPRVIIGSNEALPMEEGSEVAKLSSHSMDLYEYKLEKVREELRKHALPLCKSASETPLPPLRAINHEIPLIDPTKVYSWRPSKCPEALRPQWDEKRAAYVRTGRWKVTTSSNAMPMMFIKKPSKPGEPIRMRNVIDLRERNANTHKKSSPLPDIEGIMRRCARAKYRSMLDGQDAYEQIRIRPEHVERTTVTTPEGNMVSYVIQQGDCNAPATYQALMNHLFAAYIGQFMDVYLDDIIIYSNTLEDHVKHVKIVLDILHKEKLYLSERKLQFLAKEMKILGRIVDDEGIRMDPDKVDAIARWKTPTNRDLLRGFIGAAGYLAEDIDRVRIPMGILSSLTGDTVPFRWEFTHQRAFEDVKRLAVQCKDHHRVPLKYGEGTDPVNVITDGCVTGIAGVVSQGSDWKTAKVAAFYSAKLNPAQQNYPVHEIEMLAGVETMLRHRDILQGVKFKWFTDHKGLIHLLEQKKLSGRQARWLEKISEFDFEVVYVPGTENILSDALSRIYSNDAPGTVRAKSEYTYHDVIDHESIGLELSSMPILVGSEGESLVQEDTTAETPAGDGKTKKTRKPRTRKVIAPAETGRPETSKEFAARTVRNFVLRGPGEQKEGGSHTQQQPNEPEKLVIRIPAKKTTEEEERDRQYAEIAQTLRKEIDKIEPMTIHELVAEGRNPINLIASIRDRYGEDKVLSKILENPKAYKNMEVRDGLIYMKIMKDAPILCVPNILINGRSAREIVIAEAHTMLAHLGYRKTLAYLREIVWWKTMANDVKEYCDTCIKCKKTKSSNHKPYGLLNPLEVPTRPWEVIGIDFMTSLPNSKGRDGTYDMLTVVIDHLTSMVHLVPSKSHLDITY